MIDKKISGPADLSLEEWLQDFPQPPPAARAMNGPHESLVSTWISQGWTSLPGHHGSWQLPEGDATVPATSVPASQLVQHYV